MAFLESVSNCTGYVFEHLVEKVVTEIKEGKLSEQSATYEEPNMQDRPQFLPVLRRPLL